MTFEDEASLENTKKKIFFTIKSYCCFINIQELDFHSDAYVYCFLSQLSSSPTLMIFR